MLINNIFLQRLARQSLSLYSQSKSCKNRVNSKLEIIFENFYLEPQGPLQVFKEKTGTECFSVSLKYDPIFKICNLKYSYTVLERGSIEEDSIIANKHNTGSPPHSESFRSK